MSFKLTFFLEFSKDSLALKRETSSPLPTRTPLDPDVPPGERSQPSRTRKSTRDLSTLTWSSGTGNLSKRSWLNFATAALLFSRMFWSQRLKCPKPWFSTRRCEVTTIGTSASSPQVSSESKWFKTPRMATRMLSSRVRNWRAHTQFVLDWRSTTQSSTTKSWTVQTSPASSPSRHSTTQSRT